MRRIATLTAALALCASTAHSQINIGVSDCLAGSSLNSFTNTCTSNTGIYSLFGSMMLPAGTFAGFAGTQSVIEICSAGSTLSDWWRADACRAPGFVLTADASVGISCLTPWDLAAPAISTLTAQYGVSGPNRERITLSSSLAPGDVHDLVNDGQTELAVFRLTITRASTVGAGSCSGCVVGADVILRSIDVMPVSGSPLHLTAPLFSDVVSYNGGGHCLPTPAINRTWGAVKALYR